MNNGEPTNRTEEKMAACERPEVTLLDLGSSVLKVEVYMGHYPRCVLGILTPAGMQCMPVVQLTRTQVEQVSNALADALHSWEAADHE